MPTEIQVPQVKWSMLEWKSPREKPKNDERILMDCNGEVVGGRFVDGEFVARTWGHSFKDIKLWASWPTPPK